MFLEYIVTVDSETLFDRNDVILNVEGTFKCNDDLQIEAC